MAKKDTAKPRGKPEAAEAQEKAKEAEAGPYAELTRRLNRYRLGAVLGILVTVVLFGASVFVVAYSGVESMHAFEELPKYRVNALVLEYRKAAKAFDKSMAGTLAKLDDEQAQITLQKSRALTGQILQSERAFDQILVHYGEAMALAAEQVGGALEWNRYFQADIQVLRDNSAARQASLRTIFDRFPAPDVPEGNGGTTPAIPSQSAADPDGKN